MKKLKISLIVLVGLSIISCTKTIDKKLNSQDLEEVNKLVIEKYNDAPNKAKYIKDNLATQLGFIELGGKTGAPEDKIPTFDLTINDLSKDYDSIKSAKIKNKANNEKLDNFLKLVDAKTACKSKYEGYLKMKLKFNNQFNKDILYVVLNYKYVNEYDTEYFNEKIKLTDKVAKGFKDDVEVVTTEKHNNAANFMYTKVPQSTMTEFLMKGLKVSITDIVFKDKTELMYRDSDWEYLD